MKRLPRPVLSFYGDDFTGSTDVMEVLASNGLDTLLFLHRPEAKDIAVACERFAAIGIAGISRSQGVAWMDAELPAIYRALSEIGAPLCHYKVCSTFDSSSSIGNIGRAIQIGRATFKSQTATPLVVGAPALRRYTAFGQLFASVGNTPHRIDRHPTMSVHPSTPMDEADLRLHLARQAPLRIGLYDIVTQQSSDADKALSDQWSGNDVVLLDVLDERSQECAGRAIWELAESQAGTLFCAGSSGVEYALVNHWRKAGYSNIQPTPMRADRVDKIIGISGSCSPVTADQIAAAERDGFACLRANPLLLLNAASRAAEERRLQETAYDALAHDRSVLIFTAAGPDDPSLQEVSRYLLGHGLDHAAAMGRLARTMGELLRTLVSVSGVERVVIAGGDTSGHAVQALGLTALKMSAALAPGGPLCAGYVRVDERPAIEIALKGGQIGGPRYFASVRAGRNLG